jgi:hypothetical protein
MCCIEHVGGAIFARSVAVAAAGPHVQRLYVQPPTPRAHVVHDSAARMFSAHCLVLVFVCADVPSAVCLLRHPACTTVDSHERVRTDMTAQGETGVSQVAQGL